MDKEERVKIKIVGRTLYVPKADLMRDLGIERQEQAKPLKDKREMV